MKCRPCAGARRRAMAARRRQVSRPTAAAAHGAKALRRGVFPIKSFIQTHTRRIVRPASPAEAARAGWPRERGATRQTGERNGVSGRSVRHATRGQPRGERRAQYGDVSSCSGRSHSAAENTVLYCVPRLYQNVDGLGMQALATATKRAFRGALGDTAGRMNAHRRCRRHTVCRGRACRRGRSARRLPVIDAKWQHNRTRGAVLE